MNFREVLAALLSFAIAVAIPLHVAAWPAHGDAYATFNGNPNVTITNINTSGGIATSRTTCKTPCFIQASASAITATGTSVPYQDLSYSWNFGDVSGIEIFTNPATGQSVNANSRQTGPEAAYVYRGVGTGTYRITLTITGKNGSGYVSTTVTKDITVTAFTPSTTWYYDSNAAGGGDGSIGAPFNTLTTVSSKIQFNNNVQIYLKRGSDWVSAGSTAYIDVVNSAGFRISAYGSGANPIVGTATETSSGGQRILSIRTSSSGDVSDAVVSNVDFKVTGSMFTSASIVGAVVNDNNHTLANIYFDNCSFTTGMTAAHSMAGLLVAQFYAVNTTGNFDGFGVWGGSINSLPGDLAFGQAFFGGSRNWHFIVGLTNVNGAATSNGSLSTGSHHFYQSVGNHVLNRWINFGSSYVGNNATRNYGAKIDNYPPPKINVATSGPNLVFSAGASNGSGGNYIRMTLSTTTYASPTAQYTDGTSVYIDGVAGTGYNDVVSAIGGAVTNVGPTGNNGQGIWPISIVNGTQMDLVGTLYDAGHTYLPGLFGIVGVSPAGNVTNYVLVDSNNMTGTQRAFDAQNNWANSYASQISNYVIQSNAVHDYPYDSNTSVPIALSLTYRDNRHWANLTRTLIPSQGVVAQDHTIIYRYYRNKFYTASGVTGGSGAATLVFNATGVSWTNPQTFTDNIIYDARVSASTISLDSFTSDAAWTVDRNQYYAPASGGNYFYDGLTAKSLSQWKAVGPNLFDKNPNTSYPGDANYGNPGWTVPPTKWSDMNFLLKRDLDPASNDNDPMWLEKAA